VPSIRATEFDRRGKSLHVYPNDWLTAHPAIAGRLKALLGPDLHTFMENLQVQVPVELRHGYYFLSGFRAHSGGNTNAAVLVSARRRVIHAMLFVRGRLTTWSEDSHRVPHALADALAAHWWEQYMYTKELERAA
jgi:hypothetical protein